VEEYVDLMKRCWSANPLSRPVSFDQVVEELQGIKKELQEWKCRAAVERTSTGNTNKADPGQEDQLTKAGSDPNPGAETERLNKDPEPEQSKTKPHIEFPRSPFE